MYSTTHWLSLISWLNLPQECGTRTCQWDKPVCQPGSSPCCWRHSFIGVDHSRQILWQKMTQSKCYKKKTRHFWLLSLLSQTAHQTGTQRGSWPRGCPQPCCARTASCVAGASTLTSWTGWSCRCRRSSGSSPSFPSPGHSSQGCREQGGRRGPWGGKTVEDTRPPVQHTTPCGPNIGATHVVFVRAWQPSEVLPISCQGWFYTRFTLWHQFRLGL